MRWGIGKANPYLESREERENFAGRAWMVYS